MKKRRILIAVGALSALAAACGSNGGDSPATNAEGTGPVLGPDGMPVVGPDGQPVVGPDGQPLGPDGQPQAGPDGQPQAGPDGQPGPDPGAMPTTPPNGNSSAPGGTPLECVAGVPATTQIPRLLNREYEATVRDLLGVSAVDGMPVSEALIGDSDGPMTPDAWRIYGDVAEKIAADVMAGPNRTMFIDCDPAAAGCLDDTITSFGRKIFRRPLTDAELTRFQALGQTDPPGTPEEVAQTTLEAFLMSPSFLLKPEIGATAEGPGFALTPHEVATRLSFLLWGTVPDDELNRAADAGELASAQQIGEQATRMIQVRDKTGPLISAFHNEWLQMNNDAQHWWDRDHDTAIFPLYDPAKKVSWKAELDAFFEEVAFAGGSYRDLLLSNVAFVNQDNAEIYGLNAADYGAELQRVELDPATRPGFLTRAGFLASYADYDSTSPILRGAFISVYLLGVNPGAPIAGAAMATVDGMFPTKRAYTEALTSPAECIGCHSVVNQAGFTLEGFDAMGKVQTVDQRFGGAIDASVTTATVPFGGDRNIEISSPLQLMEEIANTPKATQEYAKAWVAYAYGRSPNPNDNCVVNQLDTELAASGTILDVLTDLTAAESFRIRVREN